MWYMKWWDNGKRVKARMPDGAWRRGGYRAETRYCWASRA
jgi:hypothetical protein